MKNKDKDSLYAEPLKQVEDFAFDENVTAVFDDMIQRSIPGYADIEKMVGVLARKYAQPNSNCYDLGCSLGAATLSMREAIDAPDVRIVAVDNSESMVEKCRKNIETNKSKIPVDVICSDVCDAEIKNSSFVVMNFTLQFIKLDKRLDLLKKINAGMLPGGVLVLSEKIIFGEEEENNSQIELYHTFKKMNGYSELEISQKRTALENVLVSETLRDHEDRLVKASFRDNFVWFQCFNFMSMVAFKC